MTIDITAKIRQSLNNLKDITDPKLEEVLKPDYELYCCAPFLLPTQASCLLAGLATMDWETVYSMITLRGIERDINKGLQIGGKLTPPQSCDGKWNFHEYVIYSFPVPHDSLDYLKNIYEFIQKGIEEGSLKHTPFKQPDGTQEKLLTPEDVVKYAREVGIEIPGEMTVALENLRPSIKTLALPKIFPNQINFGVEYRKKRIEINRLKPVSMSSSKVLEPSSESYEQCRKQQAALSSDEKKMSLRDLIFRIALCRPRMELLNSEGVVQLKQLLIEHAPCKETLFHKTHWHPAELSLAFYGIDCNTILLETMNQTSDLVTQIIILRDVVTMIDRNERIFENFCNYVEAKNIDQFKVSIEDFTTFATEKAIKLPFHWPTPNQDTNQSKSTSRESLKSKKPETLRKEMMGMAAELARKFAERNSKPTPKPATLARSKDMLALVNLINQIGGLETAIDNIDPEWLSQGPSNRGAK
jgi:hypothetical protein